MHRKTSDAWYDPLLSRGIAMASMSRFDTHEVFNQSPPYENVNLFTSDQPLREAVAANGAAGQISALSAFGQLWGTADMFALARRANENPPKLHTFDAKGFRSDTIEFHPAYHHFMRESVAAGLHASTWTDSGQRAEAPAEVARAARFYMTAQVENGHQCPLTMTRAALAALAVEPALAAKVAPKVVTRSYDATFRPWWEKAGMTLGMGMTEKQGGTDVRAITTTATPEGDAYSVVGHKWFFSAPMCDAFLVLAQAPGGLTCFLMPRFRPDGAVNALRFQRLKDKLGNRSNASSEVEFTEAFAWRVGDEGAGVRTILQMVQLTRLDCAVASAGLMRMALVQALHHCRHRDVFQKKLSDQPMMRAVLADMALDLEGAVAFAMRLARALDGAAKDAREAAYARLMTPVAKYWICKLAPAFAFEAMECLGGNGYVEESVMPRLYREAPVNAIWEGSGNVMCLDMLRALRRAEERELVRSLSQEVGASAIDAADEGIANEPTARVTAAKLATLASAAALKASAPPAIADAYVRLRLVQPRGALYGAQDLDAATIEVLLQRALPEA
jgi:putative acyl-CoA dehydrogenase